MISAVAIPQTLQFIACDDAAHNNRTAVMSNNDSVSPLFFVEGSSVFQVMDPTPEGDMAVLFRFSPVNGGTSFMVTGRSIPTHQDYIFKISSSHLRNSTTKEAVCANFVSPFTSKTYAWTSVPSTTSIKVILREQGRSDVLGTFETNMLLKSELVPGHLVGQFTCNANAVAWSSVEECAFVVGTLCACGYAFRASTKAAQAAGTAAEVGLILTMTAASACSLM